MTWSPSFNVIFSKSPLSLNIPGPTAVTMPCVAFLFCFLLGNVRKSGAILLIFFVFSNCDFLRNCRKLQILGNWFLWGLEESWGKGERRGRGEGLNLGNVAFCG